MTSKTDLDWRWTQVKSTLKAIEEIAATSDIPYDSRTTIDEDLASDLALTFLYKSELLDDSSMMAILIKKGFLKFGSE